MKDCSNAGGHEWAPMGELSKKSLNLSDLISKIQGAMPTPPKGSGRKSKPMGKILLFMLQIVEPIQIVYLGGSNMAWVRFMAEVHHKFGHFHIRMGSDPETTMTVMSGEKFKNR